MIQKTIKNPVSFSGIGLHTGKVINVSLSPAPENTGIVFIVKNKKIKAELKNVCHTSRAIVLGSGKTTVSTVEHFLASLYIKGIFNILITLNEGEIPAMDGSALRFLDILKKCGISRQKKAIPVLKLKRPFTLSDKDKLIMALPSEQLKISYNIDFDHPFLRNQTIHFEKIDQKIFTDKIAPARTFGFKKEVDTLLKKGLARGGSLKNALVLTKQGYMNKNLRFQDECIRHKVLDFIGALALLNQPIQGQFRIFRSGHGFDIKFLKKIQKQE